MPKGAKPGENRFGGFQGSSQKYREQRIINEVIPRLKTYIGKMSFNGITPYCRFCAELFNDGLPINEKTIGYRTIEQNNLYWTLVGELYYKHWGTNEQLKSQQQALAGKLAIKQEVRLQAKLDQALKENHALKATLRAHGSTDKDQSELTSAQTEPTTEFRDKFDKTCRALKLVLDATDGTFEADTSAIKITCTYDDLEPKEGLVPKQLAEPYITWLKAKEDKTGGRS